MANLPPGLRLMHFALRLSTIGSGLMALLVPMAIEVSTPLLFVVFFTSSAVLLGLNFRLQDPGSETFGSLPLNAHIAAYILSTAVFAAVMAISRL
jgi:hypothetical protein